MLAHHRFAPLLLFVLASCAATGGVAWSDAETITVRLTDYRFTPAQLALQHGRPYRLVLVNEGREHHEFTAPEFFRRAVVRDRSVLVPGGHEIAVQPGKITSLDLVAPPTGKYQLTCADHDTFGMEGTIVVE